MKQPYTCSPVLRSYYESKEYAEWLNTIEWGYYCTFTTRYSMTVRAARRAVERLFNHLQKKIGGIQLFWVAEPFDTKYGYHIHALIHFTNPTIQGAIELIKKAWQVVTKGKGGKEYNNTVIEPYVKGLGANYYVSKYMMRNNADYDIMTGYNSKVDKIDG